MSKYCSLLLLLVFSPLHLRAWGVDGHRAVAWIADQHLSRKAKREITNLLGAESMAIASTWPDEVRPLPEFKETGPWHYVDTPFGLNYDQYVQQLQTRTDANAYSAFNQELAILKDRSKPREQRVEALKFVIHLVGDMHQPMHTGLSEDQGGNKILLKYRGRDTNLHSLWDSGLLDYQGLTPIEMQQYYEKSTPPPVRQWQHDDLTRWLFESYQLSQGLYAEVAQNSDLDYRYFPAHVQILQQRILQAGIRLAGVLNKALG